MPEQCGFWRGERLEAEFTALVPERTKSGGTKNMSTPSSVGRMSGLIAFAGGQD